MHVRFDQDERPFLLDSEMRWPIEPNTFLHHISRIRGKTSSPRTWRSYAYQFADWLRFCERAGLEWKHATELNIATYRNILAAEASSHTNRSLKRNTINHKLGVICQFYRFARQRGWIEVLPFDLAGTRVPFKGGAGCGSRATGETLNNNLRLRQASEDLTIPARRDVRQFVGSFHRWRDRLMAEIMWLSGMRCAETCSLSLRDLPNNPALLKKDAVAVTITGKGQKRRAVLFPTRWLRSVDRYVHIERRRCVSVGGEPILNVFLGRSGKPLQPSAVTRVFLTNFRRTRLKIRPHTLRHCYAVERLAYLQDIGAPNPLKIVQMELGHAHMSTTERYLHVTEFMRIEVIERHNSFVDRLLEE